LQPQLGIYLFFVDDTYYPSMDVSNVVYVKVKQPYIYDLSNEIIMKRLKIKDKDALLFTYIEKDKREFELDKIVSKKIMLCIQNFLTKDI
jgi:hypothetical protein